MDKSGILPVLKWLIRSFEVTGFKGSSHSYSYWLNPNDGWAKAYPETTGYILKTLLQLDSDFPQFKLVSLAVQQADWLCNQQLSNGAFPSGKVGTDKPSVFNTGQVLLGLLEVWKINKNTHLEKAIVQAVEWLLSDRDIDKRWRSHAWVEGYDPAYYSRVIWPILYAAKVTRHTDWIDRLLPSWQYYSALQTDAFSYRKWGFHPGVPAYTHTIAYTLRGLLESAVILKDQHTLTQVKQSAEYIIYLYDQNNGLGGAYDENWKGNYSFICITGHAQLAVFFMRLYEITTQKKFRLQAVSLFNDISTVPYSGWNRKNRGGIAGSKPFYGAYNKLRYPNWAAKFYLDAWYSIFKGSGV